MLTYTRACAFHRIQPVHETRLRATPEMYVLARPHTHRYARATTDIHAHESEHIHACGTARTFSCRRAYTHCTDLEHRTPPKSFVNPGKFLGWFQPIMSMSDDDIRRMCGLDAFVLFRDQSIAHSINLIKLKRSKTCSQVLLRFIKICLKQCLFMSLAGVVILVPVYVSGEVLCRRTQKFLPP